MMLSNKKVWGAKMLSVQQRVEHRKETQRRYQLSRGGKIAGSRAVKTYRQTVKGREANCRGQARHRLFSKPPICAGAILDTYLLQLCWSDIENIPIADHTVYLNGVPQTDRSKYSLVEYKIFIDLSLESFEAFGQLGNVTDFEWWVRKNLGHGKYIDSKTHSFSISKHVEKLKKELATC